MTHRRTPITVSRRTLALALAASAAAGVLAGALSAAPAASQARPLASAAPTGCKGFAVDVSGALKALSVVVGDEAQYAAFIPDAYQDGLKHNSGAFASITGKLDTIVKQVVAENAAFTKLETPLLTTEKACLGT